MYINILAIIYLYFDVSSSIIALYFDRAREALRQCLPDQLKDTTFSTCLKDDNSTKRWLAQLLKNLENPGVPGLPGGPGGIPLPT
jgi:CCR4-NOT transcription complex subunit 9